jgi:uncharacterized protein YecE (DUF72 family)
MTIHIGTSGWSYEHWRDAFYPHGLPAGRRLAHYVTRFDTVELNASFYRWPRAERFAAWRDQLPPGFRLSVKAPRGLTHARRLHEPEVWIERIAEVRRVLGPTFGVLLVQLPPTMERDDARLDYFLETLPDEIETAVELRHPSWNTEEVFALLERHGAAYCVMSGAGLPCVLRATARTVVVRLHGPDHEHLYAGSYSDDDLRWWADRIREWDAAGHDVYAYFNNDGEAHAVRNAETLRQLLGV